MNMAKTIFTVTIACCMAFFLHISPLLASPHAAPERVKAVMVGDRLVDVSLQLGVVPEAMAVRASMWPKAGQLRQATQLLGCPVRVTKKQPDTIKDYMVTHGVTRLILEKSAQFCLYRKARPADVAKLVSGVPNITIEYVDFTKGVPAAITQVAAILGKPEKGKKLVSSYQKDMKKVEAGLPRQGLDKRVLILNGNYLPANGKSFVRIEAPGGYSDQYILTPLGCKNVAGMMISETMKVNKGHVSSKRLRGLREANPDIIIATGNSFAVQMALHAALQRTPELAAVPALHNNAIFALPFYGDSSVIEYPQIFTQWKAALSH